MEYVQRNYRQHICRDRWRCFGIKHKETDLYIGVDHASWHSGLESYADRFVRELREEMDRWIAHRPDYARALVPCEAGEEAPEIFQAMSAVARKSGIGPMSAVAGAVARWTGEALRREFGLKEVFVENGGDIYADMVQDMDIAVFAGMSPLSGRIGFRVEAWQSPLGICTSSGTVGPSLSFGKADAVLIICRDALLADTYATAYANRIQTEDDIPSCMEAIRQESDILGAMVVKDKKVGICGDFGLRFFDEEFAPKV